MGIRVLLPPEQDKMACKFTCNVMSEVLIAEIYHFPDSDVFRLQLCLLQ